MKSRPRRMDQRRHDGKREEAREREEEDERDYQETPGNDRAPHHCWSGDDTAMSMLLGLETRLLKCWSMDLSRIPPVGPR